MSKLEHVIDEIEDYLDGCKFQPLSKSSIIVDKKILDGKLRELRNLIPDEIKKYQTIISNKDAILDDARQKAHTLIDDAQARRNELINEHEVMKQAYEQAGEVINSAAEQARGILDEAQTESNGMKEAAVRYTDSLLENVERTLQASIDTTNTHLKELLEDFTTFRDTVRENRAALVMPEVRREETVSSAGDGKSFAEEKSSSEGKGNTPDITSSSKGKEGRSRGKFLRRSKALEEAEEEKEETAHPSASQTASPQGEAGEKDKAESLPPEGEG
ncbi:MAG: ATPase [Lachnospiraceae bacterium]|nr:ATPase [Lachnospiraceae bacterium]